MNDLGKLISSLRRIQPAEHAELARVLDEAFSTDQWLRSTLGLSREAFRGFWRFNAQMYLKLDEAILLGAYDGDRLAGTALGCPGDYAPSLDMLWLYSWRCLHLGPRALWSIGRFYFAMSRLTEARQPCLRLVDLAVDDAHRNRGLGGRLLAAWEDEARALDRPAVQLECEAVNPALRLYQ